MFSCKFGKIYKNTTGRRLLIIAVSIVAKEALANETVNYDTEIKTVNLSQTRKLSKRGVQVKQ